MSATQVLSFITTTTIFGTPADVTLSELAVESVLPGQRGNGGGDEGDGDSGAEDD